MLLTNGINNVLFFFWNRTISCILYEIHVLLQKKFFFNFSFMKSITNIAEIAQNGVQQKHFFSRIGQRCTVAE